jgi:hypothetical protein
MLDGAKLRLYLQVAKRAPLLFHFEANRDDGPKNKKKKLELEFPARTSSAVAFRHGECESHSVTARCLVTSEGKKMTRGTPRPCLGPLAIRAYLAPSDCRQWVGPSRGVSTWMWFKSAIWPMQLLPVDDGFKWRVPT